MKKLIPALSLLFACSSPPPEAGAKYTAVMQTLVLAREDPEGVTAGFNLDGVDSDSRDSRSCGKQDFIDADGREGIDNQLASFVPLLELAGEGAVEGLVQTAINEGRLLVIYEIQTYADGRATLRAYRGEDTPLLGTDNLILAGQTLAVNAADPELGAAGEGRIEGNIIEVGPFSLRFPVIVFEVLYELNLTGAHVRFVLDGEGDITGGVVGGAASMEELLDFLHTASERVGGDLEGLLGGGLRDSADLDRQGGECTKMSMGVTFRAVPAFTF